MATIDNAIVAVPVGQTMNLRSAPNSDTILYTPRSGTSLTCDADTSDAEWIKVTNYSRTCYGMRKFIDTSACSNPSANNLFGGTGSSKYIRQSGTRKAVVFNLQWALKRLGYNPGTIDGVFGQDTLNAVNAYQDDKGGSHDGVVGDQTKAWLVADLQ